jgi:hypothetical protein
LGHDQAVAGIAELLYDTVQIVETDDLQRIGDELKEYLLRIDEVRNRSRWRKIHNGAVRRAGIFAEIIQYATCLLLFALAIVSLFMPANELFNLVRDERLVGLGCGIALLPVAFVVVFRSERVGPLFGSCRDRRDILLARTLIASAVAASVAIYRLQPWPSLLEGVVAGGVLEGIRRRGWQARRALQGPDEKSVASTYLSPELIRHVAPASRPSLRCPLMPAKIARVFVSYSRSSDWAKSCAQTLHDAIVATGSKCFLDTQGIAAGTNWRTYLNAELTRANLFVYLADGDSVARRWPAAETESALRDRWNTGLPEIVIVTNPQLSQQLDHVPCLPVFRALLAGHLEEVKGSLEAPARLVPYTDSAVAELVERARPYAYRSASAISSELAEWLSRVWSGPRSVIRLTLNLGSLLGLIALLFGLLEWTLRLAPALHHSRFNSANYLAAHGVLYPTFLITALAFGYVVRLAAAARFELRGNRGTGPYQAQQLLASGFGLLLLTWSPQVRLSTMVVALIVALIGWNEAEASITTMELNDPQFIRVGE